MLARILAPALLLAALAVEAPAQSVADADLEAAWERLSPADRREVAGWFRLELEGVRTGRLELVRRVAAQAEVDPGFWPVAGPLPWFDPGGKRRRLDPDADRSARIRERFGVADEPRLWTYDFGSRRLLRHGELRDPDRVFREALRGRSPGLDLARAEVMRQLDDGLLFDANAALEFAWSDEDGAASPDVSLFQALAAEADLRLTLSDALGVVRWVDGEESAPAPSTAEEREALDARVREIFEEVRSARATVEALTRVYFEPRPELAPPFDDLLALHALWLSADSDPTVLVHRLPAPGGLEPFLADWRETFRLEKLRTGAVYRQRSLTGAEAPVRALLERILREFGALEPRPEPEPTVQPTAEPTVEPTAEPLRPEAAPTELSPAAEAQLLAEIGRLRGRELERLTGVCREAALASGAPQVELVRVWSARASADLGELGPPPVFGAHDAKRYGGGPKRRRIGPGKRLWDALAQQVVREAPSAEELDYDYDFATGEVVVLEREREDDFELRGLLAGRLPEEDLARAYLLSRLDAGAGVRAETEFFAHLYSDRDGNAYEGITLGEVWASEVELEVPDVDVLAYIRGIWNDPTVLPPLSESDHARWYPRMSDSLARVRHRSQVVRALGAVWFDGRPALDHGYDASIDILHALIARSGENAGRISERLEQDGLRFVQQGLKEITGLGDEGWNAGNARRDALVDGRRRIRAAVLAALADEGLVGG